MPATPASLTARHLSQPHRRALAGAAALVLAEAAIELARPWPLQVVVDQALGGRPYPAALSALAGTPSWLVAVLAALLMVLLTVLGAAAGFGASVLVGRTAESIGCRLRRRTHGRLLAQPPAFFRRHRSAELVNRVVSDVNRVEDAVVAWWEVAVPETLVLVGTLVMLTLIDPWLAVAALAVCPPLVLVIVRRRALVRSARHQLRHEEGALVAQVQDVVRNIRLVQSFGAEPETASAFAQRSRRFRAAGVHALLVEERLAPLADLVLAVGAAGVLVLGALRVEQGSMTTGSLLVALTYVAGLHAPLRSLTSLSSTLARTEASRERLAEVLVRDVEPTRPRMETTGLAGDIVLEDVTFGYDGTRVLDRVDLHLPAGRTTALTGPTGVGKSTVLQLLLGFESPWSGRILVGGRDLATLSVGSVRRHTAYVPQDALLLDDTVRANIALGRRGALAGEVEAAARTALVTEFTDRVPEGLDLQVGEAGQQLSGGQRRRIAIARAVLRDADLMLLDEPTEGLDDEAAELVLAALSASSVGRTVVVVTHDPRVLRWADEVRSLSSSAWSSQDLALALETGRR